ncbi:ABC transporter ATP-binding protein [Mobilicoccus pelagius]|uniref:Putative peptide ABC transporter ATP-binding protein n=1 Tax=Mobilicoccus pelagius NBRC 104925 TaxID=1089455 RepID=H5UQR2_9MICO|nr:putative peptide ABC transporter ATP-binding protein [Mobilicoccus pelagius NBRC 104925]
MAAHTPASIPDGTSATTDRRRHAVGTEPLLSIRDLTVRFTRAGEEPFTAVDHVSFDVHPGQTVGLVGESGCGKSVTSLAIMGLLPRRGNEVTGEVMFDGTDLLRLGASEMRDRRGRDVAMIFQDPLSSLNPVVPIGLQVTEVIERHRRMKRSEARPIAEELLRKVGIPDPARRLKEYPHQLSGGMRQRALIAMALACEPRLLIADEPTTALDVTIQAQILRLLRELVEESGTALIMITHDLGVVAGLCDRVNVLYGGRIVERADRHELFAAPRHPYTNGLLASIPRLDAPRGRRLDPVPGSVADNLPWDSACAFAPRCSQPIEICRERTPELVDEPSAGPRPRALRCHNPVAPEDQVTAAGRPPSAPSTATTATTTTRTTGTATPAGGGASVAAPRDVVRDERADRPDPSSHIDRHGRPDQPEETR